MLRKRSRGTTSKQGLMADSNSLRSSSEKYNKPTSFFSSPRLFTNFTSKCFSETESILSPTSILDSTKPFSGFKSPFWSETSSPRTPGSEQKRYWDKLDSKVVGLGLVDALIDEKNGETTSKPEARKILLGSQLKIQIPPFLPSMISPSESLKSSSEFGIRTKNSQLSSLSPSDSFKSSAEFGIKTRNSHLGSSTGSFSLSDLGKPVFDSENSASENQNSPRVLTGCLSVSEMELSEDYTRVISHGPNPRTVHIFDNCIIESSCFDFGCTDSAKENGFLHDHTNYPSESFLSFCFYCKKNLGQGKDIYMYRGERAFCSHECRYQGMLLEEGIDNLEAENEFGTS